MNKHKKSGLLLLCVLASTTGCKSAEEECKELQATVAEGQEYYSSNFSKKEPSEWKAFLAPLREKGEKAVSSCEAAEMTTDVEKSKDALEKLANKEALIDEMLKVDEIHDSPESWKKKYCSKELRPVLDQHDATKHCCAKTHTLEEIRGNGCSKFTRELEELRLRAERRCAYLARDECVPLPPEGDKGFTFTGGGGTVFVLYHPLGGISSQCSGVADAIKMMSGKSAEVDLDDDKKMCGVSAK